MSDRKILDQVHEECKILCKDIKKYVEKIKKNIRDNDDAFKTEYSKKGIQTGFSKRRTLLGHYGKIYSISWAKHKETTICSASQDGKLMLWNAHTENKLLAIPLKSAWVMTCIYSPSGTYIACKLSIYYILLLILI